MFESSSDEAPGPVNVESGIKRGVPSIITKDVTISGSVSSDGEVQLDGVIEGDLHCAKTVINEGATLSGNVAAQTVVVRGNISGSVWAQQLSIEATAYVEGDINYEDLTIEQGAFFEGRSRHLDNPLGEAPMLDEKISGAEAGRVTKKICSKSRNETPITEASAPGREPMDSRQPYESSK